jgi:hypothetical protein
MLSAVPSVKEMTMREQYLLFETEERRWAERVWQALDPERRSTIIVALAEMALASLRSAPRPRAKERGDDA